MLIAIQIEERDLMAFHGGAYARYRDEVSMILPCRKEEPAARSPGCRCDAPRLSDRGSERPPAPSCDRPIGRRGGRSTVISPQRQSIL